MKEYQVCGRYDIWRGVWRVVQTNVRELRVEAATRQAFEKDVQCFCNDLAGSADHRVRFKKLTKSMWTFSCRYIDREIINGRLVTRDEGNELRARYEQAG